MKFIVVTAYNSIRPSPIYRARKKKAGITSVILHRGMRWYDTENAPEWLKKKNATSYDAIKQAGSVVNLKESDWRPLSSWSHKSSEAGKFYDGGSHAAQITASIPAGLIVSTPRTGNGSLIEREWVVMGAPGTVKIEKSMG